MSNTKNTGGWTPEKRAAAAEKTRQNKPWEKSTGPRTPAGKAAIKNNAIKHGGYSEAYKDLISALKAQEKWLKSLALDD